MSRRLSRTRHFFAGNYMFYTLKELLIERRYALFVLDRHILHLIYVILTLKVLRGV